MWGSLGTSLGLFFFFASRALIGDRLFDFADGHFFFDRPVAQREPVFVFFEAEQGAGVPHLQLAVAQEFLDFVRQLQ